MALPYPASAERYARFCDWAWSQAMPYLAEPRRDARIVELELQAQWFGGEFGREFTGTDGEQIEVVQFGHWNRGAGPDFSEAAIRIDGALHRGAVELDLDLRDWERHGHGANPAFNSVILHVVTDGPASRRAYTRTAAHREVCQVLLPPYYGIQGRPDFLPEAFPGRCVAPLSGMPDSAVASLLESAAQYRLLGKQARLRAMTAGTGRSQALFQSFAECLGYQRNKLAMAILAQRCPISELKGLDHPTVEARLFGIAGFFPKKQEASQVCHEPGSYQSALESQWLCHQGEAPAPRQIQIPWEYTGGRPLNHPHRRVAALASLVPCWNLLEGLCQNGVVEFAGQFVDNSPENVRKFGKSWLRNVDNLFKSLSHPFWDHHLSLIARASDRPARLIGASRSRDLIGNVLIPMAMELESCWESYVELRSGENNQKLRRASLRLFGANQKRAARFQKRYYQQQGLLQIYADFCLEDFSDCAHCSFPEQLSQWRTQLPDGLQKNHLRPSSCMPGKNL
jgi:Protein of unknown function (DUF2851)